MRLREKLEKPKPEREAKYSPKDVLFLMVLGSGAHGDVAWYLQDDAVKSENGVLAGFVHS